MADPKLADLIAEIELTEPNIRWPEQPDFPGSQPRRLETQISRPQFPMTPVQLDSSSQVPVPLLNECPRTQQTNQVIDVFRNQLVQAVQTNNRLREHFDSILEGVDPSKKQATQEAISNADLPSLLNAVVDDASAIERDLATMQIQRNTDVEQRHGEVEQSENGILDLHQRKQGRIIELSDTANNDVFSTPIGSRRSSLSSLYDFTDFYEGKDDPPPPSWDAFTHPVYFNAMIVSMMFMLGRTTGEDIMVRTHIGNLADSWMVPLLMMASVYTGISIFRLQKTIPTSYLVFLIVALSGYYATGDLPKLEIRSIFQYLDLRIARIGTSILKNYVSTAIGTAIDSLIDAELVTRNVVLSKASIHIPLLPEVCQVGLTYELTKWATMMKAGVEIVLDVLNVEHADRHLLPVVVGYTVGSQNLWTMSKHVLKLLAYSLATTFTNEITSKENLLNAAQVVGENSGLRIPTAILIAAARITSPSGITHGDLRSTLRPVLSIGAAVFVMNCVTLSLTLRDWLFAKSSLPIFRPLLTDQQGKTLQSAGKYSFYLGVMMFSLVSLTSLSTLPESTQREVMAYLVDVGINTGTTMGMSWYALDAASRL